MVAVARGAAVGSRQDALRRDPEQGQSSRRNPRSGGTPQVRRPSGLARGREGAGPEGIPASVEALLALLPDALRSTVLAHFRHVLTANGVGTHDDAAGISDPGGAAGR